MHTQETGSLCDRAQHVQQNILLILFHLLLIYSKVITWSFCYQLRSQFKDASA